MAHPHRLMTDVGPALEISTTSRITSGELWK